MTAEVITYRGRSAVRDVGKALGLSLDVIDQLSQAARLVAPKAPSPNLNWPKRASTMPTERSGNSSN